MCNDRDLKASDYIVVIGRQCGSGGRELGKALSAKLGVPYYDNTLLCEAAKQLGVRPELLERNDERAPSKLRAWLGACYGAMNESYPVEPFVDADIQRLQGFVIRRIMEQGPCVIVGRAADYIGRDLENLCSIFLHAPLKQRVERVLARDASCSSSREAEDLIFATDRRRESYYNYFSGRNWGKAENYHLSIDSSKMSMDSIVDLICHYLESIKK